MTVGSRPESNAPLLEVELDSRGLPVSYLSSLLRVLQAVVREVARTNEDTRRLFSQQPQPVLLLSAHVTGENLALRFAFADPLDSTPMPQLSARTFESFLERFSQFLKGLAQPGLWGISVKGGQRRRYESDMARRMDQLRVELRRFPRARLSFDRRTILLEGDHMEIG